MKKCLFFLKIHLILLDKHLFEMLFSPFFQKKESAESQLKIIFPWKLLIFVEKSGLNVTYFISLISLQKFERKKLKIMSNPIVIHAALIFKKKEYKFQHMWSFPIYQKFSAMYHMYTFQEQYFKFSTSMVLSKFCILPEFN